MNKQKVKTAKKPRRASSASKNSKPKGKGKAKRPLAELSGIFKDDPLWDEFVEAMRRARAEEDANTDVSG